MKSLLISILFFFSLNGVADEKSAEIKLSMSDCDELTSYSDIEVCYLKLNTQTDKYLNSEYAELINYLDKLENKQHKQRLIKAQRAWIKFRDSDCLFYSDNQPIRMNQCLQSKTFQRLKELENMNTPFAMGCNGCPW